MSINITSAAAKKIVALIEANPGEDGLRVAVNSGGCGGYQYDFAFESSPMGDDSIIQFEGAKVYVDNISHVLLEGCIIDYVDNLVSSAFEITNPNAASTCGCGNSFSCTK